MSLLDLSLSFFFTENVPNGKPMVQAFPEREAYSNAWEAVVPINFVAFQFYGVTTVTYITYTVWMAPRRVGSEPGFMDKFNFCFGNVWPERWWWVLIQLASRASLSVMQIIFVGGGLHAQIYTSLICMFVSTMLQFSYVPFLHRMDNSIDLLFKLILLVCLILLASFVDQSQLQHAKLEEINNM